MDRIIGIETYCQECGYEARYEDETKAPHHELYECPRCEAPLVRSKFTVCECGTTVYLDGDPNQCEGCGQYYNGFGQPLQDPEYWDPDDYYGTFGPLNDPNEDW